MSKRKRFHSSFESLDFAKMSGNADECGHDGRGGDCSSSHGASSSLSNESSKSSLFTDTSFSSDCNDGISERTGSVVSSQTSLTSNDSEYSFGQDDELLGLPQHDRVRDVENKVKDGDEVVPKNNEVLRGKH